MFWLEKNTSTNTGTGNQNVSLAVQISSAYILVCCTLPRRQTAVSYLGCLLLSEGKDGGATSLLRKLHLHPLIDVSELDGACALFAQRKLGLP